ncbi:hypothetical protein BC938DRAFT_476265 [Jimgerdemannia flammicorona]|uniref:SHSP domain-containing protein n=1 Tax=Jimgerdemannia flammicorona TaxID=994334 RepID=A0A433QQN7_9FUNG|nr:hypothetical protein BC938DRAFT_476265 [Jimgerdemannia flammicorona]
MQARSKKQADAGTAQEIGYAGAGQQADAGTAQRAGADRQADAGTTQRAGADRQVDAATAQDTSQAGTGQQADARIAQEIGHAAQRAGQGPTSFKRKKDDTYTIVVSTPGVIYEDHVEIAVDGDDDNLIISGDVMGMFQNISGTVVIDNMPDRVERRVLLPMKIDLECSIGTEVANGLTKITVNKVKTRPQKILKQKR